MLYRIQRVRLVANIFIVYLKETDWQKLAALHKARASEWTQPFVHRRARRETHPIYDFLFVYYRLSPAKLEEWHPGIGTSLEAADLPKAFSDKYYVHTGDRIELNLKAIDTATHRRMHFALNLAKAVANRPPKFGCFGLHEWAMVYSADSSENIRHAERLPLRLPQDAINEIVRSRPITCSHYDAFRFFTPEAQPFNRIQPTRDTRIELEQCGCLHTNMDLYRWAGECMPWAGSELLWDCFQLAVRARQLDMQASPYDCSSLGFAPICIETTEGRAEYEQEQRAIYEAALPLRQRLIQQLETTLM